MVSPSDVCIILTATIFVNLDKVGLVQKNAEERRKIYMKRTMQWLENTKFKIVLVENSGANMNELSNALEIYKDRFEIVSYCERDLEDAKYLKNDRSKGCSELFAIQHSYKVSSFAKESQIICKVTARYFIPDLENYLSEQNLDKYVALAQHDPNRCELVGCNKEGFNEVFYQYALDKDGNRQGHVEHVYKFRMTRLGDKVFRFPEFQIEPTLRGGVDGMYSII